MQRVGPRGFERRVDRFISPRPPHPGGFELCILDEIVLGRVDPRNTLCTLEDEESAFLRVFPLQGDPKLLVLDEVVPGSADPRSTCCTLKPEGSAFLERIFRVSVQRAK